MGKAKVEKIELGLEKYKETFFYDMHTYKEKQFSLYLEST